MTKDDNLVQWTARTLYYDKIRCNPSMIDFKWSEANQETKDEVQSLASEYTQELASKSPKTYQWLLNNAPEFK